MLGGFVRPPAEDQDERAATAASAPQRQARSSRAARSLSPRLRGRLCGQRHGIAIVQQLSPAQRKRKEHLAELGGRLGAAEVAGQFLRGLQRTRRPAPNSATSPTATGDLSSGNTAAMARAFGYQERLQQEHVLRSNAAARMASAAALTATPWLQARVQAAGAVATAGAAVAALLHVHTPCATKTAAGILDALPLAATASPAPLSASAEASMAAATSPALR